MAKVIINGRPLIIDGAPALSTDCCCDDPPPPCPNCCVSIDWGTFDGTGDLIDAGYDGMIIKMVMPTKNSRLVCADEQVTITIDILDTESPPTGTPYISWDRHWEYISHTPAVGTDGLVFEEGLIEWGTTIPIAEEYSVTLQLNECWSDNATQYGDIEAGMRGGDFVLMTATSCTSAECCEPEFPCDDCCWYLEPFDNTANSYELDDAGNPVFWAVNEFGDRAKITIEGTNNGVYCLGEELTIRVKLVPNEYTGDPWIPEVFVSANGGWKHEGHSPDLGNGSLEIGPAPPMSIEWGDDVEGFEYTANIKVPCPVTAPDSLSIGFKNRYPGGPGAASVDIDFVCCSGVASEFSCDDCYETPTTEYFFAHIGCAPPPPFTDLCDLEPPLTTCGQLYYAGSVANTVPPPDGSQNYAWLWLLKGCFYGPDRDQQILDYSQELFDWANGVGCPGNGSGGVVNFGVITDYYVAGMVGAYLQVPQAPDQVIEECINITPDDCSLCPDEC